MHETLELLQERLEDVTEALESQIPSEDPIGVAHANWSFACVSKTELIQDVQSVIDFIDGHETDELDESEALMKDYIRRLDHLVTHTIPQMWGNAGQAIPAFQITIDGLRKALSPLVTEDERAESSRRLTTVKRALRRLEAELAQLDPRVNSLESMVGRIEDAHAAADQLPTDLESLSEGRATVSKLQEGASPDVARVVQLSRA